MTADHFALFLFVVCIVIGVVYVDPAQVPLSALAGIAVLLFGIAVVAVVALVQVARDVNR